MPNTIKVWNRETRQDDTIPVESMTNEDLIDQLISDSDYGHGDSLDSEQIETLKAELLRRMTK